MPLPHASCVSARPAVRALGRDRTRCTALPCTAHHGSAARETRLNLSASGRPSPAWGCAGSNVQWRCLGRHAPCGMHVHEKSIAVRQESPHMPRRSRAGRAALHGPSPRFPGRCRGRCRPCERACASPSCFRLEAPSSCSDGCFRLLYSTVQLGPRLPRERDGGHASCHVSAAGGRVGRRPGGGLGDPVQPGARLLADEAGGWGWPNRPARSLGACCALGRHMLHACIRIRPSPSRRAARSVMTCRRRLGPTTTPCQSRVPRGARTNGLELRCTRYDGYSRS